MLPLSADSLRAHFDAVPPGTVGIEEEVMLLDADTLDLAPRASELLAVLDGDPRFKLELPAAQFEIVAGPATSVPELARELAGARADLAAAADSLGLRLAAAGVHPHSAGVGTLNRGERYAHTLTEYGPIAARQLVSALQVHVAVGGAARTLAVHNALRSYLPLLAALAANAPFYEGRDCGLASVRPKLCELLPRQGVPPVIESWEAFAEEIAWGERAGSLTGARTWWWELRPHPTHGTLELRVPDAQSTVSSAAAVAGFAHCLVVWLAAGYDDGERLPVAATWRIEENRWSACRHGTHGAMAALDTGESRPTLARLDALMDALTPTATTIDAQGTLAAARRLAHAGGSATALRTAGEGGVRTATRWLADMFLARERG